MHLGASYVNSMATNQHSMAWMRTRKKLDDGAVARRGGRDGRGERVHTFVFSGMMDVSLDVVWRMKA